MGGEVIALKGVYMAQVGRDGGKSNFVKHTRNNTRAGINWTHDCAFISLPVVLASLKHRKMAAESRYRSAFITTRQMPPSQSSTIGVLAFRSQ
jgi:hypothetical protein